MFAVAETVVEVTWYVFDGTVVQVPGAIVGDCSNRKVVYGAGGGGSGQVNLSVLAVGCV